MGTNTKENEKEQGLENRNNMGKEKEIDKCPIDHKNHTIRAEGTFDRSETHTIKLEGTTTTVGATVNAGTKKKGVTYSGPKLGSYRSGPLGPELTPAWKDDADYRANNMDKTWIMKWTGVNFPSKDEYTIRALADDVLKVRIGGVEVASREED